MLPVSASADTTITAGVIMEKMPERERFAYVAGVVEGLREALDRRDGKQPASDRKDASALPTDDLDLGEPIRIQLSQSPSLGPGR